MSKLGGFRKQRLNPIEVMKGFGWPTSHIKFDKNLKRWDGSASYDIVRGSCHDGTLIFTQELLQRALIDIANQRACCLKDDIDSENLGGINYILGDMYLATVFGMVDLPAGRYPGERQRVRMPVKCEYVYRKEGGVNE